jgi:EAL and modified HD-GYP domain-containing signal transduction protein
MTSSAVPAVAPVFFRILADRKGAPGAVLLDAAGPLEPELIERSAALTAALPGLFAPGRSDAAVLGAAGWRELAQPALCRVDDSFAAAALAPGVQWVDGDWCLRPPAKPVGAQAASRTLALQLVEKVAKEADTHEIEALLRQDPALSYQLLRVVNSLGVGAGRRITSFAQALLILGRQQLRRWLNLMLFAAPGQSGDLRAGMLLARVAVRARAMELLAKERGCDRLTQEQAFMTGMFSLLGVLFGMPLAELLAPLSLGEAVAGALLEHDGELGALLALLEHAEHGISVTARLAALQLDTRAYNGALFEATEWMLGALRQGLGQGDTRD